MKYGDLISRQAAIDIANRLIYPRDEYQQYNQAINNYAAELVQLPSAQPENRRGQWLHVLDTEECEYWECSECGEQWIFEEGRTPYDEEVYYCPNCGADLRGDDQILFVTLQVALKKDEEEDDAAD